MIDNNSCDHNGQSRQRYGNDCDDEDRDSPSYRYANPDPNDDCKQNSLERICEKALAN
jgi:hypothetical protein